MAKFVKVKTKNGKFMFFKNGKMVAKNSVPLPVREADPGLEIVLPDAPEPQKEEIKECLICGEEGVRRRFLSGINFRLCVEHYGKVGVGKLAQALREKGIS